MNTARITTRIQWINARDSAITSYLESHSVRKLQLGSGTNTMHGWFNTDLSPSSPEVFFLDATTKFPFESQSFDYIYSEHHIEHIKYEHAAYMLRECYRVLRPGGKIRIATPNLRMILNLYTSHHDASQSEYIKFIVDMFMPNIQSYNSVFVINNAFRNWGHQFLYDDITLHDTMKAVGFANISCYSAGESQDEHFVGIEKHGQFIGNESINQFETIVLEGTRL